jgi:hypothetical protein
MPETRWQQKLLHVAWAAPALLLLLCGLQLAWQDRLWLSSRASGGSLQPAPALSMTALVRSGLIHRSSNALAGSDGHAERITRCNGALKVSKVGTPG